MPFKLLLPGGSQGHKKTPAGFAKKYLVVAKLLRFHGNLPQVQLDTQFRTQGHYGCVDRQPSSIDPMARGEEPLPDAVFQRPVQGKHRRGVQLGHVSSHVSKQVVVLGTSQLVSGKPEHVHQVAGALGSMESARFPSGKVLVAVN